MRGDEYLASTLDRRPKFHLYPDIAVINGIAWDVSMYFPILRNMSINSGFLQKITPGGELIYFRDDQLVAGIAESARDDIRRSPYSVHGYFQNARGFFAATESRVVPMLIFGEHNMQNLSAAKAACLSAGITENQFYAAIKTFRGTARRLQLVAENRGRAVYLDFAHAPSKVKATVDAVSERYPGHRIVACFELAILQPQCRIP
ncbi:MAG: cyanophycin synthetase [Bacteroidales bacterium]